MSDSYLKGLEEHSGKELEAPRHCLMVQTPESYWPPEEQRITHKSRMETGMVSFVMHNISFDSYL